MIKKKILNKKGFAVQFSWLFVLIAGAVMLGFFVSIITNQTSGVEARSAQRATQEINSLFKISMAAGDTQKIVLFDKKIIFYCDDISEYHVEESLKHSRYDYNVIFSPVELEGRELIIQTKVFEAPFRTMPLLYVTNKDIEYVFVGSSALVIQLYNAMPENATVKSITNPSQLAGHPNNNYDHVVFVIDKNEGISLPSLSYFNSPADADRVYAVVIDAEGGSAYNYGEISFYKYDGSSFGSPEISYFFGLETVVGAIISHDKTSYNCSLGKIMQRVELLNNLHERRMEYYFDNVEDVCKPRYVGLPTSAKKLFSDMQTYARLTPSVTNFISLFDVVTRLRNLNTNIIRTTECPPIY